MTSPSKAELRQTAIARRAGVAAQVNAAGMRALTQRLIACVPTSQPDIIVAGYHAIHSEVDLQEAIETLHRDGVTIALPALPEGEDKLTFRRWSPGEPLFAGTFGTVEPAADAPALKPHIIFVPLLAFDDRGYRIGYGKGYYDITLGELRSGGHRFQALGVAFAGQQIDRVPDESHDVPLDAIVTETGVIIPGRTE